MRLLSQKSPYRYGSIKDDNGGNDDRISGNTSMRFTLSQYWSYLVFGWLNDLLKVGSQKAQLDMEDLNMLPLPATAVPCWTFDTFERELRRERNGWNFIWSFGRSLGGDFARAGLLKLVHVCLMFVGPQVLKYMIAYLSGDKNLIHAFGLILLVTCSQLGMSFCLQHYIYLCHLTGLRFRNCMVLSVYKKALYLSPNRFPNRMNISTNTDGEIINLISIDASRLQNAWTFLHAIWYTFLQICLAIYFLWRELGPSSLGGLAVIIFMIPGTGAIVVRLGGIQKKLMKAKDDRIELSNEVFGMMRTIKLHVWENFFGNRIEQKRSEELRELLGFFIYKSFINMFLAAVPQLVATATFAVYVFSGNHLDVGQALTSLMLFDLLRVPLFTLPKIISHLVDASVSLSRWVSFLQIEDYQPVTEGDLKNDGEMSIRFNASFAYYVETTNSCEESMSEKSGSSEAGHKLLLGSNIQIQLLQSQLVDAEYEIKRLLQQNSNTAAKCDDVKIQKQYLSQFGSKDDENCRIIDEQSVPQMLPFPLSLRRINFACKRGEFIAVVGPVGSGKSTFLKALLGEVKPLFDGSVHVKGRLAYFNQSPFIMNETLRSNIIFDQETKSFQHDRYERAISSCALQHDLNILPGGEFNKIGERGVTLSGGQKTRVAMARIVYRNADINLLDDPLAALDSHVANHMFHKCVVEELLLDGKNSKERNKTVILVTNALKFLSHPLLDRILVLKDGKVKEDGSYEDLIGNSQSLFSSYQKFIQEPLLEKRTQNEIDVGENTSITEANNSEISLSNLDHHESKQHDTTAVKDLIRNELKERAVGDVSPDIYLIWVRAGGGILVGVIVLFLFLSVGLIDVLSAWWLTNWSQKSNDSDSEVWFLLIYAVINGIQLFVVLARVLILSIVSLRASKKIFSKMLGALLRAPVLFFDTTPIGRIVNLFSKDVYTLDEEVNENLWYYLITLSNLLSSIMVILVVSPFFSVLVIPMIRFYLRQQRFFNKTYRELKRLDSVARTPIHAMLRETLDGVVTIRAHRNEPFFLNRMHEMLNKQQNAYYLIFSAQCWLAVRLDVIGAAIIAFACLFAVMQHQVFGADEVYTGLAGLSISFALNVTESINRSVRIASDLEASMVAVERIEQCCQVSPESDAEFEEDRRELVDNNWPRHGKIEFRNVQLRYRKDLPLALKDLNLVIPGGSKVGVVGRTGSGKSTLMMSLMRVVELDKGSILVDDVDIKSIGLSRVRSRIAVVPQDAVLFSGTVRTNLDPNNCSNDDSIYEILRRVGLYSGTETHTVGKIKSLDDEVRNGGANFSAGQRQLMVIARALIADVNVFILDESTAAVDTDMALYINRLMQTELKKATVITIAHKLNTIMNSDFILMMNDGVAAEFDTPTALRDRGGMFKEMVDASENRGVSL